MNSQSETKLLDVKFILRLTFIVVGILEARLFEACMKFDFS